MFSFSVHLQIFKQNNQPDAHSVVTSFIVLSCKRCSTCFGQHFAHDQEHFLTAVAASGFRVKAKVDVFPASLLTSRPRLETHLH
jgi:hypothetical protein